MRDSDMDVGLPSSRFPFPAVNEPAPPIVPEIGGQEQALWTVSVL